MHIAYNCAMCVNFTPAQPDRIAEHFGAMVKDVPYQRETYPGYPAPIVARKKRGAARGKLVCAPAVFGMVPGWTKDLQMYKHTYNARSETVTEKASFRNAWQRGQFCIIPTDAFFEPNYESGKPVRWAIRHADDKPLAIAGIWDMRPDGPDGEPLVSFSMLTINADTHPLMKRFHKPGDEKRSVVMLDTDEVDAWLDADAGSAPAFLRHYAAEKLAAEAMPEQAAEEEEESRQAALF